MATIAVYPRLGTTYLDAANVEITSAGAIVPVSAYIEDALRRGDLLTNDPLDVYQPDDRSGQALPVNAAPATAEYLVATANASLTNERVLTAGTGISLTPGAGTLTVTSTAGGAPSNASYVVMGNDATLSDERRLVGGSGISITDGGAGGTVTIAATGGGGGAPTDASYVVLAPHSGLSDERLLSTGGGITVTVGATTVTLTNSLIDASYVVLGNHSGLSNERVLTAGSGISIADGGAGGALTISATGGGGGAPNDASYLTLAANGTLTSERVLTAGTGISFTDGGAGSTLTINNTGAPANAEYLVSTANGTLTNERVLTAGSGISLTPGSGILTIAATGGGSGSLNGMLDLSSYSGVVRGTLGNNTARAANRTAINNAIQDAIAQSKQLLVPPGRYEIHGGAIVIDESRFRWNGDLGARFVQYSLDQPVIHIGPPLGTGGGAVVENVILDGCELMYAGTGTANTNPQILAGANALELTGVWMSTFRNIDIGDVNQGLAGATSVPFRGILLDGITGTTPCFSNSFRDIRIKHFGQWAIYSPRSGFDAASTGSVWENIYISGGSSDAQRDLSAQNGGAISFTNHGQDTFRQVNVEWLKCPVPFIFETSTISVESINFEGLHLKNPSSDSAGFFYLPFARLATTLPFINNCTILASNNVTSAAVFLAGDEAVISYTNLHVENTTKDVTFSVLEAAHGAVTGVQISDHGTYFASAANVDRFDNFTSSVVTNVWGVLADFNNDTPQTLSNGNVTHYAFRTPGVLRMAPSGGNKTITLSRDISSTDDCRIPRGVKRRVFNSNTSAVSNILVQNHNGTNLANGTTGIAFGAAMDFAFDGTDWVRVA